MSDRRFRRLAHVFHEHGHRTYHLSLLNSVGLASRQLSTPLLGHQPKVETVTLRSAVGSAGGDALDAVTAAVDLTGQPDNPPLDDPIFSGQYDGLDPGKWDHRAHLTYQYTYRLQAPTNKSPAAIRAIVDLAATRRLWATITTRDYIHLLDGGVPAEVIALSEFQPPYTPAASAIRPPAQLFGWWAYRPYSISPRRHAWGWRPAGEAYEPPGSTRRYGTRTQAASWPSPSA